MRLAFFVSLLRSSSPPPPPAAGRVDWEPEYDEVQQRGHQIHLRYEPPSANYFRGSNLMWFGELRSEYVVGDEEVELEESNVISQPIVGGRVTIPVPAYCQSVVFAITDGVRFDTNDGSYYRISPEFFVEEVKGKKDASGEGPMLRMYRREPDGSKTDVADASARDAASLEREAREAIMPTTTDDVTSEIVVEHLAAAEEAQRLEVSVTASEQAAFQQSRARANDLGASLGLSNLQIGEVRAAFEKYNTDPKSPDAAVPKHSFPDLLAELGFDEVVADGRDHRIWADHVGDHQDQVDLLACLRIFHALDEANEGLVIL